MSDLKERGGVLLTELDTSYDLGDDNDSDFYEEPPCLCAQQIISTMFGTILGYLALLLSPRNIYFPLAFSQGLGITMGLLGSEKSNIKAMGLREPAVVSVVIILTTYILITIVGILNEGEITLGTLTWTSFLLSNLASWIRALTRYPPPQPSAFNTHQSSPNPGISPSGFASPDRRLKFKHSGDESDWFAKSSGAMKV